jgi:opacity protein-like surface antigen
MSWHKISAAALALATALLAHIATAQANDELPTRWSGLGVGGRYAYVTNRGSDESTHMGGGVLRARSEFLGVEGAVDYRNEDLVGDVDMKSWPVSASLLFYPLPPIYALAGLGWYNTTIDFPDDSLFEDETDTELGYHFGLGVEAPIAPTVRLTGDVRWQFVDYEFDEIAESIGDVDADTYTLNAGVLFFFH